MSARSGREASFTYFSITPPQDGGWSLVPMENLLRGMRNSRDAMSLEIYAKDGVVGYCVRCNNGASFNGMFHSYYPQAHLTPHSRAADQLAGEWDWLHLDEDEFALVRPLSLARESYLPLQIYEDRMLEQSAMDPMAGLIGLLSSGSRTVGGAEGGDRLGMRLLLKPAPADWGAKHQAEMQRRRDGEDRAARPGSPESSGPSMGAVLGLGAAGGLALANWWLWQQDLMPYLVALDAGAVILGGAGLAIWKKFLKGSPKRPYLDEALVENKLKALCFYSELQLFRIYRDMSDEDVAREDLDKLVHCLRAFDDPAGNGWKEGRVRKYSGQLAAQGARDHPFQAGMQELDWVDREAASRCVLSAREAASLWHLPLGTDDMAPMERTASGSLSPYLGDLADLGEDGGPLVGLDDGGNGIRLPESAVRKHSIILGRSGVGKSTLIKHVVAHKLERKAEGKDDSAIVVIDPHADLVRDLLALVPPEVADKVRLLDFGRTDRVPAMNLVDPELFPYRDRCVDTIVTTVKNLWEHWGNRLEDLLTNALLIIYEYNEHPDTPRSEMLTVLDVVSLLEDGVVSGQGRNQKTEMSAEQERILGRVRDPILKAWFNSYLGWPPDQRAEAVAPVRSRIGAYAKSQYASVVLGQRESTIVLSDVLTNGLVLLVSTAAGTIGKAVASILGGSMVSLVESVLREQERLPTRERKRMLLIADEFQTITGADWESMFAEIRKYGCSMMLATQSLARLDGGDRRLKEGVLGNVGLIIGYQMSADDARIVAPEMDSSRIEERNLVNLYPHHCYMRINTDKKCYPVFSMTTLAPPEEAKGSEESKELVLEKMAAYTSDWSEARQKLMAEVDRRLEISGKVGMGLSAKEKSPYDQAMNAGGGAGRRGRSRDGGSGGGGGRVVPVEPEPAGPAAPAASGAVPGPDPGVPAAAVVVSGRSAPEGEGGDDEELTDLDRMYLATSDDDPEGPPPVVRRPSADGGNGAGGNGSGGNGSVVPAVISAGSPAPAPAQAPVGDSRGVSASASASAGRTAVAERVTDGSLRGIKVDDVKKSRLKQEDLEYLCSLSSSDPGLRALLDKRLGDQLSHSKRKLRAELEKGLEEEVASRVEVQVEARLSKIREEERLNARVELGLSASGATVPALADDSAPAPEGGSVRAAGQAWVPKHLQRSRRR